MLSVRDERRSRSKSPGGRDRDRSRSRDDRSPARKERRSSKYSPSGSEDESADDRRRKEKKASKYDEASDDDRRRSHKSSKKSRDDDSDISDSRHRSSRSSKSNRRDETSSDEDRDRRRDRDRRDKKKHDESDSERRSSKKDRSDKKKSRHSESSDSENDGKSRKSKKDSERNGNVPPYAQPPYGYPPGYAANYPPPPPGGYPDTRHMSFAVGDPRYAPPGGYLPTPQQPPHQRSGSFSGGQRYAEPDRYQYAQPDQNVTYKYPDGKGGEKQYIKTYNARGEPQMIEIKGEYDRKRPEKDKKYVDDKYERRDKKDKDDDRHDRKDKKDKKYHDDKYGSPPDDVTRKLGHLAVGGALGAATLGVAGRHVSHDGGKPPASPLLEAYKGTYQSMSPMPGALVLSKSGADSDLSDLDLESDDSDDSNDPNADIKRKIKKLEREKAKSQKERAAKSKSHDHDLELRNRQNSTISPRSSDTHIEVREPRGRVASDASIISPVAGRRRVMFYDANTDAKKIAAALEGTHRPANLKPLIEILPGLSDDDVMALRLEYKAVAKVGGQGINIAKHVKMRVPGNFGKAAYAVCLGRWESEAFWANTWYQGGATRRELLIESLMGRTNSDIREIKNCFKDKRYNDSLEKCLKTELKADKFRAAILLALEERRMPESSPLDTRLVRADVEELYHALSGSGGETAMIDIIVVRSDQHLREVLKIFEKTHKVNFARAMIDKSRNLVGETLAHVLNGALNRGMRDALLLHQAIAETAPGKERAELLISRLVRLHWEPKHLERVKQQYEARYQTPVELAIKKEVMSQMKTDDGRAWAQFCIELVITNV